MDGFRKEREVEIGMRNGEGKGVPDPSQSDDPRVERSAPGLRLHEGRRLQLQFAPNCASEDICDAMERLQLPLANEDAFCTRYALMELVSNAVRASRDRAAVVPVCVEIWLDGNRMRFKVSDAAGGFDLSLLPYDFTGSDEEVDLVSDAFDSYRKASNFKRFGLGLLLSRRAADEFRLRFVDAKGKPAPWKGEGSVYGTVITFSKGTSRAGEVQARERRRYPRRASYAKAQADRALAYVRDFSEAGARISIVGPACPSPGETLWLKSTLPAQDGLDIRGRCEVVWLASIGPYREAGVRFLDPAEEMQKSLRRISQWPKEGDGRDESASTVMVQLLDGAAESYPRPPTTGAAEITESGSGLGRAIGARPEKLATLHDSEQVVET